MPLAYYALAAGREFWTEHWGRHDVAELLDLAAVSPLTTLLVQALPEQGVVLEAGCGLGQYVVHLRRHGYRAIGADWSLEALAACRRFAPGTPLAVMDLRSLALRQGSVAAYVSLGVVEHDPAGPAAIVAEAARVLAPGGRLLLSVPYLNGVRRLAAPLVARRNARVRATGGEFYQFAFTRAEVRGFLEARGFSVRAFHPYDPARLVRGALRAVRRGRGAARAGAAPAGARPASPRGRGGVARMARALLYTPAGLRLLGHMILAVAVKT